MVSYAKNASGILLFLFLIVIISYNKIMNAAHSVIKKRLDMKSKARNVHSG